MEKEGEIKPMIIENSVVTDIRKEEYESNPWLVDSVSELLKYCCPECNYSEKDLELFSSHAQENHERSSSLINDVNKMISKNEHDMVKEEIKEEDYEQILAENPGIQRHPEHIKQQSQRTRDFHVLFDTE